MADPVISVKLIVLYRFLSHNFPRSKTMWFLANSSIWHRKMLLNLTIPHPTTSLNVFLSQFPSFSSYLEQRTVRNTRGPFLVLFSFMKEQVFVPKTPNIFAIMTDPPWPTVNCLYYLVCITLVVSWMAGWYGFFANNGEKRNCSNKGNKLLESVWIIYKIKRPIARFNPGPTPGPIPGTTLEPISRPAPGPTPRTHIWVLSLFHSFGPTPQLITDLTLWLVHLCMTSPCSLNGVLNL